jgi:hypothetical protein
MNKNYFTDVRVTHKGLGQFPIRWDVWSPDMVMFKSNNLVKKLLPKENILSYKSKGDRDQQMAKKTGGKLVSQSNYSGGTHTYRSNDKYKAVHVKLTNVKKDFVGADVDFIDMTKRKDSVGNNLGRLDILTYVCADHRVNEWVRDPHTQQWIQKSNPNIAPCDEGYRVAYGGQGECNSMSMDEWDEYLDIIKGIRQFLVEVVDPFRKGEFDVSELMVA